MRKNLLLALALFLFSGCTNQIKKEKPEDVEIARIRISSMIRDKKTSQDEKISLIKNKLKDYDKKERNEIFFSKKEPLFDMTIKNGLDKVIKFLIDNKIDPKTTYVNYSNYRVSSSLVACINDKQDILDYLLKKGVKFDIQQQFECALSKRNLAKIKSLIDRGVNLNSTNINGITPLTLAMHWKDKILLSTLIDKGADVNAKNTNGETPINAIATQYDNIDPENILPILNILIQHGANVNNQGSDGVSALDMAIFATRDKNKDVYLQIIKRLLDAGADVNLKSSTWDTPLHIAAYAGNNDIVKLLIEHGADVNAKNMMGKTPLDIARNRGSKEITDLLISYGAK
jgi:ankyrin repeat protein